MCPVGSGRRRVMTEEQALDQRPDETDPNNENGTAVNQAEAIVAKAVVVEPLGAIASRPGYYPSRETLDREMREIKDEVLRMGSLVASQIGLALDALVSHDAEKA